MYVAVWAMRKIAGVKSNDKINFKEFVDFFNKVDWDASLYKTTQTRPIFKDSAGVSQLYHLVTLEHE